MYENKMENEDGVYALVTELCTRTASKYAAQTKVPQKRLVAKMRSQAYEIILKKSSIEYNCSKGEPVVDLLSYYLTSQRNVKNVAEFRRSVELKKIISRIRQTDFAENKDIIYNVLKLLVGLIDAVKEDYSSELFQNPFSFGLFNEMLPKPSREFFGSPEPYPYYPPHVFQLPFSMKRKPELDSQSKTYTEYSVDTFDSKSFIPDLSIGDRVEIKSYCSPLSMESLHSRPISATPYSRSGSSIGFPRLTAPRDLQIPSNIPSESKVIFETPSEAEVQEVFRAKMGSVDIWEIATNVDKDIPDDIWEKASKMPPITERQLIATSSREMVLWRRVYGNMLSDLTVISEKLFIRNIMYLLIGIETNSFPFCEQSKCFYLKEDLVLEGISRQHINGYVTDLLKVGTYYRRLFHFAFDNTLDEQFHRNGLIHEAARDVIRKYLLAFRLKTTEIYEDYSKAGFDDDNRIPTLLQILHHMEPLKYEIETIVSIFRLMDPEQKATIPLGAELMSYLFNEISLVTHRQTARTLYNSLFSICAVYFKFIERFIFEGKLDDRFFEFFIRKDSAYVNTRSKRYWDKGFYIAACEAVPEFLRPLAKFILLCGKSLRLLKHCNPSDPLVLLISADHPSVKCCSSFSELERQQQILDVYRTRCLFVSGEPVTFDQILLKQEAERKAFTEMASVKQAETMEKIVAERKRLAQLIIAEKQHSLRVLEQAMAEAKAAKHAAKQRERNRFRLQKEAERAREEVDSKLREDERNKMLEYYSKLNQEVEKSKIHTEWKIRRLQLDEARMQLLSTEERNLKREKLELEHKKNEAMAMSIQSTCSAISEENEGENKEFQLEEDTETKGDVSIISEDSNQVNVKSSSGVFSAICNAAKSIFGGKSEETVDNKKYLDAQGNVVPIDTENNTSKYTLSSDVIGADLSETNDNQEYLKMREDAIKNKLKVMTHEFGQTDTDYNLKDPPVLTSSLLAIDEENNVEKKLLPYLEAKKNKLKILGSDHDTNPNVQPQSPTEPITEAHKQASANKLKVLGVEYNLDIEATPRNDPANIAQEEALRNKDKILGSSSSECSTLNIQIIHKRDPANVAQEEALRNRDKILGSESSRGYLSISESYAKRDPATVAQEEALRNRDKILGSESSRGYLSTSESYAKRDPANIAQEEAIRNRDKILGSETYDSIISTESVAKKEPANIAQEEALRNRDKILGSETYDSTSLIMTKSKRDPANTAQEEALCNRDKMLGSETGRMYSVEQKREPAKRAGLSLNLKPFDEILSGASQTTLGTGVLTPGDFISPLDLETPTTADVPVGAMTSDVFTPHSETNKLETGETKPDKPYLTSEGFDFSILVDENVDGEMLDLVKSTPESSPSKYTHSIRERRSMINYFDDSYSFEELDPFGVKQLKAFSKDYFSSRMDIPSNTSVYTHPAVIMEEVKKKPYHNMFSRLGPDDDDKIKVDCDNIATLTACLQRSVMLPLTYQLEVVNNSILTYFLVNLDMYEHLRSLKDYFFLMDGEFSKSICQNLFTRLMKTLNPQELLNFATLHNILDKALGSSISHVHKFSENLSFTITESPLSFQHSSPDVLQCLSLTYSVSWPLNIILSQEALLRYAKVFQFLLKMRRIFWVLGEDFAHLKLTAKLSREHSRRLMKSPQYISVQIFRHVMASMIRALDNYIVTTCILSSWKEFEIDLKKARTLDDLYDCHVVYVKKVLFRCLLNNRSTPVMKLLNDIFTVILKFSRVLKHGDWQQKEPNGPFTHTSFNQLQELFHLFEKLAKYLHRVITKLMECGYQRHLAELLSMVNLNGYYDQNYSRTRNESSRNNSENLQSP
ncbi:hypothetical protein O0L34_g13976 [Tuta absoluta]|nr:hypothetical protein O0L34_g13976 [Tuta absoluta]